MQLLRDLSLVSKDSQQIASQKKDHHAQDLNRIYFPSSIQP